MFRTHASFLLIHKMFAKIFEVRETKYQENYCRTLVRLFLLKMVCMNLHKVSNWLSFVTYTGYRAHWILPLLAEVQKIYFC